jgi:membrane associated rhomboid family serine protease
MNPLQRPLPYRYYQVTLYIILVNIVVFFGAVLFQPRLVFDLALIPGFVLQGEWYRVFTYMYAHGSQSHLFFNMLGLFFFGFPVEQKIGSWEYLIMYHLTGVLAGLFSFITYLLSGQLGVSLVGSSGAVYAILLFFAAYFPNQRIYVMFVLPLRATTLVLLYTAIEVFNSLFMTNSGVAHLTHLAGFFFAGLYLAIRLNRNILAILMGRREDDDYY